MTARPALLRGTTVSNHSANYRPGGRRSQCFFTEGNGGENGAAAALPRYRGQLARPCNSGPQEGKLPTARAQEKGRTHRVLPSSEAVRKIAHRAAEGRIIDSRQCLPRQAAVTSG